MTFKKYLILFIVVASHYCSNNVHSQMAMPFMSNTQITPSLVPFRQGDLWGYADISGKLVIQPQYSWALFFCGKIALVGIPTSKTNSTDYNMEEDFAFIKSNGELIIKFPASSTYTITDTSAQIYGAENFIIDINGNKSNLSVYQTVSYQGPYAVATNNDKCYLLNGIGALMKEVNCDSIDINGLYDANHQMIIKPGGVGPFKNGLAHLENGIDYQFMDKKGNIYNCVNPTIDKMASSWHVCPNPFINNMAIVEQNGKVGVLDTSGKLIVPFGKYYNIDQFTDGMAMVMAKEASDEILFINTGGQELRSKPNYMFYENFSEGFARIYFLKGKFNDGFVNKRGKTFQLKKKYDAIGSFSDGLCMVKSMEGSFGFIDTTGKEVIPTNLTYEEVDAFSNGLCKVKKDGLYGFIDKTGKEVIPPTLPEATAFDHGVSQLDIDPCNYCNISLINLKGEILPYYFQTMDEWTNNFHIVNDNASNLKGVINSEHQLIVPMQYSTIRIYPFGIAEVSFDVEDVHTKDYVNLKTGVKYCSNK